MLRKSFVITTRTQACHAMHHHSDISRRRGTCAEEGEAQTRDIKFDIVHTGKPVAHLMHDYKPYGSARKLKYLGQYMSPRHFAQHNFHLCQHTTEFNSIEFN
jgi:hypothetical protein